MTDHIMIGQVIALRYVVSYQILLKSARSQQGLRLASIDCFVRSQHPQYAVSRPDSLSLLDACAVHLYFAQCLCDPMAGTAFPWARSTLLLNYTHPWCQMEFLSCLPATNQLLSSPNVSTVCQEEARNPAVPRLYATRQRSGGGYGQIAVPVLVLARSQQ